MAAIRRGSQIKCGHCGLRGATLGCRLETCPTSFHLPCAREAKCSMDPTTYLIACPEHARLFRQEASSAWQLASRAVPGLQHRIHWAADIGGARGGAGAAGGARRRSRSRGEATRQLDLASITAHFEAATRALADVRQRHMQQEAAGQPTLGAAAPGSLGVAGAGGGLVAASKDEDEAEFAAKEARRMAKDISRLQPITLGGKGGSGGAAGGDTAGSGGSWGCGARGFESVGGLRDAVRTLREMVLLPLLYPEMLSRLGAGAPGGILLHGPPGTGKTLLARAVAGECARVSPRPVTLFARKGADCLGKYAGDAERTLRLIFEEARVRAPSIVFLDELDALVPSRSVRGGGTDQIYASIVSTLLALMDGVAERGHVVVIGATNRPDSIDSALRRPGRFDREVLVGLPNPEDRQAILQVHTRHWPHPPRPSLLKRVAAATAGYAGADLSALASAAVLCSLRRQQPKHMQEGDWEAQVETEVRQEKERQKQVEAGGQRLESEPVAPMAPGSSQADEARAEGEGRKVAPAAAAGVTPAAVAAGPGSFSAMSTTPDAAAPDAAAPGPGSVISRGAAASAGASGASGGWQGGRTDMGGEGAAGRAGLAAGQGSFFSALHQFADTLKRDALPWRSGGQAPKRVRVDGVQEASDRQPCPVAQVEAAAGPVPEPEAEARGAGPAPPSDVPTDTLRRKRHKGAAGSGMAASADRMDEGSTLGETAAGGAEGTSGQPVAAQAEAAHAKPAAPLAGPKGLQPEGARAAPEPPRFSDLRVRACDWRCALAEAPAPSSQREPAAILAAAGAEGGGAVAVANHVALLALPALLHMVRQLEAALGPVQLRGRAPAGVPARLAALLAALHASGDSVAGNMGAGSVERELHVLERTLMELGVVQRPVDPTAARQQGGDGSPRGGNGSHGATLGNDHQVQAAGGSSAPAQQRQPGAVQTARPGAGFDEASSSDDEGAPVQYAGVGGGEALCQGTAGGGQRSVVPCRLLLAEEPEAGESGAGAAGSGQGTRAMGAAECCAAMTLSLLDGAQMHRLTLPAFVMRGQGDPIEGCIRTVTDAAAAAARSGGGASLLVFHLPHLELWAACDDSAEDEGVQGGAAGPEEMQTRASPVAMQESRTNTTATGAGRGSGSPTSAVCVEMVSEAGCPPGPPVLALGLASSAAVRHAPHVASSLWSVFQQVVEQQVSPLQPLVILATCGCSPDRLPTQMVTFFSRSHTIPAFDAPTALCCSTGIVCCGQPPSSSLPHTPLHSRTQQQPRSPRQPQADAVYRLYSPPCGPSRVYCFPQQDVARLAVHRAACWAGKRAEVGLMFGLLRAMESKQEAPEAHKGGGREQQGGGRAGEQPTREGTGEDAGSAPAMAGAKIDVPKPLEPAPSHPKVAASEPAPSTSSLPTTLFDRLNVSERAAALRLQQQVLAAVRGVAAGLLSLPQISVARAPGPRQLSPAQGQPGNGGGREVNGELQAAPGSEVSMRDVAQAALQGQLHDLDEFLLELRRAAALIWSAAAESAAAAARRGAAKAAVTAAASAAAATTGQPISGPPVLLPGVPEAARLAASAAALLLDVAEEKCAAAAARLGLRVGSGPGAQAGWNHTLLRAAVERRKQLAAAAQQQHEQHHGQQASSPEAAVRLTASVGAVLGEAADTAGGQPAATVSGREEAGQKRGLQQQAPEVVARPDAPNLPSVAAPCPLLFAAAQRACQTLTASLQPALERLLQRALARPAGQGAGQAGELESYGSGAGEGAVLQDGAAAFTNGLDAAARKLSWLLSSWGRQNGATAFAAWLIVLPAWRPPTGAGAGSEGVQGSPPSPTSSLDVRGAVGAIVAHLETGMFK